MDLKSLLGRAQGKISNQTDKIRAVFVASQATEKAEEPVEIKPITEFDPTKYPRKLNLGCGFDIREGYLNVDFQAFHNPDLVADIRKLEMLPSDFYEEVIAQDCLEHFPRCDTQPALAEWSRLLKSGGVLKLRVPNLLGLLELFTWKDKQSIADQEMLVQCLFGTQAYNGDWHLTGFTQTLLSHYLTEAGFGNLQFSDRDHWLFEIVCTKN
ncbi:methyltransferase domain-containing protein [Leptolyngbya boryana CZ1]|uniref:Methyltransferase domain-containing protein n=1 Tax=Leptolyngbya boryana CZ1 TaxID=3060204 RepID=A0AA96X2I9_LEPBY|nr:methyltransferase domain-containing protein [Leptolyngbya boryana]WNZ44360.1 methyltransferase domain-containing protein [Leptolyngbya boryana CZ1]